jgi:hypothetical protein
MDTTSSSCFRYILSDIAPGMTIADYRRQSARPVRRRSWFGLRWR